MSRWFCATNYNRRTLQNGFGFIFVLLIISTLIAILTLTGIYLANVRSNFQTTLNNSYHSSNFESGLNIAFKILKEDVKDVDTLNDIWAMNLPAIILNEKSKIIIKIEPEDSKLNLNNLVWGDDWINEKLKIQLDDLFFKLGYNFLKTDAIIDWIDKNENPLPDGAENQYYIKNKNYKCKNNRLNSLDEIFLIKDFDKISDKNEFLKYITVFGDDEKININTASETVIETLSSSIDKQLLFEIIKLRNEHPIKNLNDLLIIPFFEKKLFDYLEPSLKMTNDMFKINITSILDADVVEKNIFIVQRTNNNFRILFASY